MFDHTSRYYSLETAEYTTADGRKISYKRRRFLPQGQELSLLQEFTMDGRYPRLDLITYKTLGDPLHFWQICDANNAMNPEELTEELSDKETKVVIRIPSPQV